MSSLSDTDRAYAAGLIDGEGCIGLYNTRTRKERRAAYYQLTVRVAMRSGAPILWLQSRFGYGTTTSHNKGSKAADVFYYVWQARNRQAETVLREILPYLVEKAPQARLALEFCEHRRQMKERLNPQRGERYPEAVLNGYDEYISRFKQMKRDFSDHLQLN